VSECRGARLQPEALCWKWRSRTLPELYQLPVGELLALIQSAAGAMPAPSEKLTSVHQRDLALDSIVTRLRYLDQVGLGYLSLDRTSRTLSGGEVQRVNLTSCLGTSLVDTLFVLDEPSVGLHPRDINRLIGIIRSLTDTGNTVVVVEHDEAMIRAADHVIEVGPSPARAAARSFFRVKSGTCYAARPASPAPICPAASGSTRPRPPPARRSPVAARDQRHEA